MHFATASMSVQRPSLENPRSVIAAPLRQWMNPADVANKPSTKKTAVECSDKHFTQVLLTRAAHEFLGGCAK